jgi:hypothetical protein
MLRNLGVRVDAAAAAGAAAGAAAAAAGLRHGRRLASCCGRLSLSGFLLLLLRKRQERRIWLCPFWQLDRRLGRRRRRCCLAGCAFRVGVVVVVLLLLLPLPRLCAPQRASEVRGRVLRPQRLERGKHIMRLHPPAVARLLCRVRRQRLYERLHGAPESGERGGMRGGEVRGAE